MNPMSSRERREDNDVETTRLHQHWMSRIIRLGGRTIQIAGANGTGRKVLRKRLTAITKIIGLEDTLRYSVLFDLKERKEISPSRTANGTVTIFLYDVTDMDSFEYIKEYVTKNIENGWNDNFIVVGNKIDCEYWRQVTIGEVCNHFNIPGKFIEVSAQLGLHIDLLQDMILRSAYPDAFNLPFTEMVKFSKRLDTFVHNKERVQLTRELTEVTTRKVLNLQRKSELLRHEGSTFGVSKQTKSGIFPAPLPMKRGPPRETMVLKEETLVESPPLDSSFDVLSKVIATGVELMKTVEKDEKTLNIAN